MQNYLLDFGCGLSERNQKFRNLNSYITDDIIMLKIIHYFLSHTSRIKSLIEIELFE
jgi:hypothetical protein